MIYIHIPFCKSRCIYCGFVSSAGKTGLADRYVDALLREMDMRRSQLTEWNPSTIYIGGGTPSFLPAETLKKLLMGIAGRVDLNRLEEYTVEVNPDDVTPDLLALLREYGVNRISMGVQTFDDCQLRFIRRRHTSEGARNAINLLKSGNWNYSLDLIYGLPYQDIESWKNSLNELLSFDPPHFSAYLLSVEEGTPLFDLCEQGNVTETGEDDIIEMYDYLIVTAGARRYDHYEISNFARPGKKAVHNSRYWENHSYLGLGAGAASFISGRRGYNGDSISEYISGIESGKLTTIYEEECGKDIYNTIIFTSLRTKKGVTLSEIPKEQQSFFISKAENLLHFDNKKYYIPETEWLHSDYIIRELMLTE